MTQEDFNSATEQTTEIEIKKTDNSQNNMHLQIKRSLDSRF